MVEELDNKEKPKRTHLCSLEELRLNEKEILAIEEFRKLVKEALGPNLLSMRLFGSKARGDSQPDSDVDIFVEVAQTTPQVVNRVIDIAFDLGLSYGVYISPRIIPKSVWEHPVWRCTPFLKNVEKEGIPL